MPLVLRPAGVAVEHDRAGASQHLDLAREPVAEIVEQPVEPTDGTLAFPLIACGSFARLVDLVALRYGPLRDLAKHLAERRLVGQMGVGR